MGLDDLVHRSRPAAGDPEGALVLLHGRGVDENDLFPLLDLLDPDRRLVGFTPRAPLQPPGHTGNHWYVVERVGYPERESFTQTYRLLDSWLAGVAEETGVSPGRTVLGGFSQGTVMSYAMGLGAGRPRPLAILAQSGFVPTVDGWEPDLTDRADLPVYISHGVSDPVIPVEFAHKARELLEGRVDLTYREHPGGHTIDPRSFDEISGWLRSALDRAEG
jgi:phospholipase/carboxylesterase